MATSRLSTRRIDWRVQVGTSNKAAQGLVIFEASVSYIPDPLAAGGPRTAIPEPVPAVLDAAGYACTPDPANPARAGERGLDLFTTDSLGEDGGHWTWTARPQLRSVNGIQMSEAVPAFSFAVPTGEGSLDLSRVQKVPASPGLGTEAAVALVERAEAAVEEMKGGAVDAARAAVQTVLDTEDIVTGDDERVPIVLANRPGWVHLGIAGDGKIIDGVRTDGTHYLRKLESPSVLSVSDDRVPMRLSLIEGWAHIDVDGAGNVLSGFRSNGDGFVRGGARTDSGRINKIAVYGDSMAGDHGGTGVSFASALADATGVEVHRGGVPGQTSTEAALRQGGLDVFFTLAGNRIPATGSVALTLNGPVGIWKTGSAWDFTGSLAGVPGTLRKAADDTWTFTRATGGTAVTCRPETRWAAEGTQRAAWVQIFRAGRNSTNAAAIKRDARAVATTGGRFLILPIYNTANEPVGSNGYNMVSAINTDHQNTYGPNYYDLRGWMIRHGLATAGITATAEDVAAINEDRLPPSLMWDTTHLTPAGRRIEAERIAHILTAKGWIY